jgi:DNA-binding MarR family transcriptional regulator
MHGATTRGTKASTKGRARPDTTNLGFLLAKASQRWNEQLHRRFSEAGYAEVRPAYGSILLPLFEEDGLRMGVLARRARLSKQTVTTLVRLMVRADLVTREQDPADGRAFVVQLTDRAREFEAVAARVLDELEARVAEQLTRAELGRLGQSLRKVMDM